MVDGVDDCWVSTWLDMATSAEDEVVVVRMTEKGSSGNLAGKPRVDTPDSEAVVVVEATESTLDMPGTSETTRLSL